MTQPLTVESLARAFKEVRDKDIPYALDWDNLVPEGQEMHREGIRGVLAYISACGWQIVPKEPTPGMIDAWMDFGRGTAGYRAMLAASPTVE